jgi:protein TonB
MTQITKEQENTTAANASGGSVATKPQPVALEVPVTVNGARTVDGSDKREPFSEKSATVLVFGHGAVIRVSTMLAPGQLIFLTNEKTKKEVVCQVVKSKSDGGAVGYVELRFTEPAPSFWGMRFPADHVLPPAAKPAAPAPAAVPAPVKAAPVVPPVASKPVPAPPLVATKAPLSPAVVAAPPVKQAAASTPTLPAAESKPAMPAAPLQIPSSSAPSTEELKQQAARLQEQLSSLLFTETPKPAAPASATETLSTPEVAEKVLNLASLAPEPAPFKPIKVAPSPQSKAASSSLADDEIKIPAWLAPLARENDAAPAANSSGASSSSAGDAVSVIPEARPELVLSEVQESSRRPETAVFGGQLLGETAQPAEANASSSKMGMFIGIAATLLLVAGGVWYSRQPGNALSGLIGSGSAPAQHASSPAGVPTSNPEPVASSAAPPSLTPTPAASSARVNPAPPPPSAPAVASAPATAVARNTAPASAPAPRNIPPVVEEPKKPSLGDVRLATPKINRDGSAAANGDAAPALLDVNPSASGSAPVSTLGASHKSEPVAPVPIGGDVKPAKLLKSVPPLYPEIARSQHVSGNVQIDALIDENGGVSSMKVLSGPALLHQAAINALKQWKYQPAELDGKPTSMHLTVTLQFRVQ